MREVGTRCAGFSLIELLAAVFLTAIVLTLAVNVFLDLGRQADAAIHHVAGIRRAVLLVDRVATDLERAVLVQRPPGTDPLNHPWIFLAEDADEDPGAERLKFVARGRRPRGDGDGTDLELVTWTLELSDTGIPELRRSGATRLPDALDRDFPGPGESKLVAENVASFGVRFLRTGATGVGTQSADWTSEWDSSTLTYSDDLPIAAEIHVALYRDDESEAIDGPVVRQIFLPLRPLDLAAILEEAGGDEAAQGEEEDGEQGAEAGMSMTACLDLHPELVAQLDPEEEDVLRSLPSALDAQEQGLLPFALPADCQ